MGIYRAQFQERIEETTPPFSTSHRAIDRQAGSVRDGANLANLVTNSKHIVHDFALVPVDRFKPVLVDLAQFSHAIHEVEPSDKAHIHGKHLRSQLKRT